MEGDHAVKELHDKGAIPCVFGKSIDAGGIGMREILFRGIRCDNQQWIYGYLTSQFKKYTEGEMLSYIKGNEFGTGEHLVKTETVGQYTGLKDKNGNKIFEGDICLYGDSIGVVEFDEDDGMFTFTFDITTCTNFGIIWSSELEIIGNVYENPELLEVGK